MAQVVLATSKYTGGLRSEPSRVEGMMGDFFEEVV